ncbi:MAG TPA: hypothetical protein VMG30_03530 [Acidobacteriota bacterium]|nr:hypothetical protein [Acidobacteriota bacterium]
MKFPISVFCAWIVLALSSGLAQTPTPLPTGAVHFDKDGNFVTGTFTFRVPLQPAPLGYLAGQPYSAEEVSQQSQILADGTRILRSNPSSYVYRDSAGRTRTERHSSLSPTGKQAVVPAIPEIIDPVAGCIYFLDIAKRVAHRVELPEPLKPLTPPQGLVLPIAAPMLMTSTPGTASSVHPETSSESLGTQVIESVPAQGRRTTTVYPAGAFGNAQPISVINELWTSLDLNLVISAKSNDPRQGDRIQTLTNIGRAEPDPALFQVPPGYKVITETGPFTITIDGSSK